MSLTADLCAGLRKLQKSCYIKHMNTNDDIDESRPVADNAPAERTIGEHEIPADLPPLPPNTRYGGQLRDYDEPFVECHVLETGFDEWSRLCFWNGMASEPESASADWHIAIPLEAVRDDGPTVEDHANDCWKAIKAIVEAEAAPEVGFLRVLSPPDPARLKCWSKEKEVARIDAEGTLQIFGTREEIEKWGKTDCVTLATATLLLRIMDLEGQLAEISRVEPAKTTPPAERPTPETDAWRKQDMHTLERAFQFMERLERQLAEARARVQKWMDQCSDMRFELIISRDELAKAREQRDRLAKACKSAKLCLSGEALPTRDRAILIINAALASMEEAP